MSLLRRTPGDVWLPRLVTLVLSLVAGLSVAYWVMRWSGVQSPVALSAVDGQLPVVADPSAVARALGAVGASALVDGSAAVASASTGRVTVVGVLAMGASRGAALLSVDGGRPQPFRVGQRVADAWVVHSVNPQAVSLLRADFPAGQTPTDADVLVLQAPVPPQAKP